MLDDAQDIATRAAALLDDPSASEYDFDYLQPYIDQQYQKLAQDLESLGMQYTEGIATVTISPGVTDLSPLQAVGSPLAAMKNPRMVKAKLASEPDTAYYVVPGPVEELLEVSPSTVYVLQWRYGNGSLQVTPVGETVTLKVYFDQTSTTMFDPSQNAIISTGYILATRVAEQVATLRGLPPAVIAYISGERKGEWAKFASRLIKLKQRANRTMPPIHTAIRTLPPAGYL